MNAHDPGRQPTASAVGLSFPSGYGQSDTHATTLSNGEPNPSRRAGTPYDGITGKEIGALVRNPQSVPKPNARWFMPSTYAEADARDHRAQRTHGEFWFLVLDVDKNHLPLADVREALETTVGDATLLLYATRSAMPDDRKWRALVPLAAPLAGVDYSDTANAFFDLLEDASAGILIPDRGLAHTGQLVFLPNRGEFYEWDIKQASRLALAPDHPIIVRRDEQRAARATAEREAQRARAEKAARRKSQAVAGETSPVDHFNERHVVAVLLGQYGYIQAGGTNNWRSPIQQSGSFATRDCGDFWISLSGSDADAGIGAATKSGHRHGDAFDLFVHFEHHGDFTAAVLAYGEEAGLCGDTVGGVHWGKGKSPGESHEDRPGDGGTNDSGAGDKSGQDAAGSDEEGGPVDLWGVFLPPSLPRGLLPTVIEEFALVQAEMMGADTGGLAAAALAVCAAALPDSIKVQVKRHDQSWTESARLWVALIGDPSTKKSPILSAAAKPLIRMDAELYREFAAAKAKYDALSKDEKCSAQPAKQVRLRIEDTTIEAAQELLKDSVEGVLCLQDELSGWFGGMDKYSGNRGSAKDRGFWLQSFNGGAYAINRVGRGPGMIENLSVSMLGGIQPGPVRKLSADAVDDGLLQRLFPIVLRPATLGKDAPAPDAATAYGKTVEALRRLRAQAPSRFGGFQPPVLRFDDGAQTIRRELEQKHLDLMALETINRKLAAHIGKYDGLFARLCLLWHAVEHCQAGTLPAIITEATASRVRRFLHGFLLPHSIAFYAGILGLSDDHDRLSAVAGYILTHRLDVVTNRDVQRGDRTMRGLERHDIQRIFEQLEALGWLQQVPGKRPSDLPHWQVNPKCHESFGERAKRESDRRSRARAEIDEITRNARGG